MKEIVKLMGIVFCWVNLGLSAPTDFSLEDLRDLNQRSVAQFIGDATYVAQPEIQSAYYLDYINAAKSYPLNGWVWFKFSSTYFSIDPTSGYYQAPDMLALANAMYLASSAYQISTPGGYWVATIPSPNPPAIPLPSTAIASFSRSNFSAWRNLQANQFMDFLANEIPSDPVTTDELAFLNFFNTKIIALQTYLIENDYDFTEITTTDNFYGMAFSVDAATSFTGLQAGYNATRHMGIVDHDVSIV